MPTTTAPNSTPFLRIETGMHTANIGRIAIDAAERYLVTASEDKTARVWDLTNGNLLQILRPPIGDGTEGKLYTVALSPDAHEVAVGGFTGPEGGQYHIYLFDRATGRLSRHIANLPNVIEHLVYSANGAYLAAALGLNNGIRVYDTSTLQEVGRDAAYGDDSNWLDFDAQGRLLSSSRDGFIRLYDTQFQLIAKQHAPGGNNPNAVVFSPDGGKLAVGFLDSTAVNVLAADDLHLLYVADTHGIDNGFLCTVAWSQDGQTLYAGGSYDSGSFGQVRLLLWSQAGRGKRKSWPLSANTILDLKPLKQLRLAYSTFDPVWGVLDNSGHKSLEKSALIVDYRGNRFEQLRLNANASVFAFTHLNNGKLQSLVFDLNQLPHQAVDADSLQPAKTTASGLNLKDWFANYHPKLNEKPLTLYPYELSRSLSISNDEQYFLLGTEWFLRYYNREGQPQWPPIVTPGIAWAVNLSEDGRFAVAAFGDGTIRWYRLSDGKEQLAFFPHADGKRWVLWTPEGFYAASANAEELIGYHLNQGDDKEGQFVDVKQLGKLFYRPDLIAQRFNGDETGIQQALAKIGDVRQVLAAGLPPSVELLSAANSTQDSPDYTLKIKVTDQGGGIGKVVYKVNGSVLEGRPADIGIPGRDPLSRRFTLAAGANVIETTVFNARGQIESQPIKTVVHIDLPEKKPVSLYVLSLGISQYRDHALQLKYADGDATSMAQALEQGGKGLFNAVHVSQPLINEQATLANLKAAVDELAAKVQPQDVFVLYMAGHGKSINGNYHFAPWDLVIKNEDSLEQNSLNQDVLSALLAKIPTSKSVLLLDTCDAGAFKMALADSASNTVIRGIEQKTALSRLMRATGRAVLAATSDNNMALEGYGQHGVFTYALLEGLKNADLDGNGRIEIIELANFVDKRVPEITKQQWHYEQFPMYDLQGQSFDIGAKP